MPAWVQILLVVVGVLVLVALIILFKVGARPKVITAETAVAPPQAVTKVDAELRLRLRWLLAERQKITAIKELRTATGMGLKEAKEYVESLQLSVAGAPVPPRPGTVELATPRPHLGLMDAATLARVRKLTADGKKILAIKEVRLATGVGLKEAREYVERLSPTQ